MSLTDTRRFNIPAIPRVGVGESYTDPTFGSRVTRVTAAAAEGHPAIVPPYTNRTFGLTKKYGPIFFLYLKGPGAGHALYSGTHPFPRIAAIPWGKLAPIEPENLNFGGTAETSSQLTWFTKVETAGKWYAVFMRYDVDAGGSAEELFRIGPLPTGEAFGDTHCAPSLDGNRVTASWFVGANEKRLAVIDLAQRKILWQTRYFTPDTKGFQRRTGTPIMSLDGQRFIIPLPVATGGTMFFGCRLDESAEGGAVSERVHVAERTYEHSCQAQLGGSMLDVYVSKANGGLDSQGNPRSPVETRGALALISSFESSLGGAPGISAWKTLFEMGGAWVSPSGVHLSGGAWQKPDRVVISSFAPSNRTYRYRGEELPAGSQQIVSVDLNTAVATNGAAGFRRACWILSATQASETVGNAGYWAEPHPMQSPDGNLIAFASDHNFHRPESEWTYGIDTYVVEVGG